MKSPLVVGYKGEIGSFILQGLLRTMPKASNIWCVDINDTEEEISSRIKKSDVIFLCVPLEKTIDWLIEWKPFLYDKIIIEQCSLKSELYEDRRLKDLKIYSMHLLFRPSVTPNKNDRTVAFLSTNFKGLHFDNEICKLTNSSAIWFKNYIEHDKEMCTQQALVHRVLLTLGDIIGKGNCQTYLGNKILELTTRISKGNSTLYEIIRSNKHLPEVLDNFKKQLKE